MRVFCLAGLVLAATVGQVQAAFVADYSPDTTGAVVQTTNFSNKHSLQILGDQFTLATDTTLTGGAIFSDLSWGAFGDSARFMIFAEADVLTPLIDIVTTLDAVDSLFTSTRTGLTRKHATISPTFLSAGTYWFSMPGNGVEIAQATGVIFNDGALRTGSVNLTNSESYGDMFFQVEGVSSEPVPEPASIAMWSMMGGIGFMARRKRKKA